MVEKAKETGKKYADVVNSALAAQSKNFEGVLDPLNWLGTSWLENWSAVSSEVSLFVAERIREDVKSQHEILNCKNLGELQSAQTKFIQTAIDQYTAETGKLAEIGQEFVERLSQKRPS